MRKPRPAPLQASAQALSAEAYIRRLDRLLVVASVVFLALAVRFFAQTL